MKDSRKNELTMDMMENVAGGGWEQIIPYAMEILNKVLDGGKDDNGGGSNGSPAPANSGPQYNQNNNNNSGAQQNSQKKSNYNSGGLNVNQAQQTA